MQIYIIFVNFAKNYYLCKSFHALLGQFNDRSKEKGGFGPQKS